MTKQVRQSIAPTHILGSTGTVEGSDLGFRSLTTFPFPNMPTVAGNPIVARGSNSDGEFVRFADGTQICSRRFVTAELPACNQSTTRLGLSGFETDGSITWTYPQAFSPVAPTLSVVAVRSDRSTIVLNVNGTIFGSSTTGWKVIVPTALALGFHPVVTFTAVGRWF